MSVVLVNQDWEVNALPYGLSGGAVRSATNAIDGTDMRIGDGSSQTSSLVLDPITLGRPDLVLGSGSISGAKGLRIEMIMKWKRVTMPGGGTVAVFTWKNIAGLFLQMQMGNAEDTPLLVGNTGTGGISVTGVRAGTAFGTAPHILRMDYREDAGGGVYFRYYIDDVLDLTYRDSSYAGLKNLYSVSHGVIGSKCVHEYIMGLTTLYVGRDPA